MDERLNGQPDDEGLATRRMVTKGVVAGGLAALFAAGGIGRVLADSEDGNEDDGDDGPEDDVDDGPEDDVDNGDENDDDGQNDTEGDNGQNGSGSSGAVKGHHKNRKGGKHRH